jgi:glucose-1-phosphate cytidylyltransferase
MTGKRKGAIKERVGGIPVVLLAGGLGTRLVEETEVKPKPMVEIGGRPILWHIMKHYAHFGFNDFYVALGYKGEVIKHYFLDYHTLSGDLLVDLGRGKVHAQRRSREDWRIHLVDTGLETNTGGRIRRLQSMIGGTFMVTYGDGVSNVDFRELLAFHRSHGLLATLTAVRPPARFGGLVFRGDRIKRFTEKPQTGEGWINGGFMVFEPGVFDYFTNDKTSLESDVLERLAEAGELAAFKHGDFWQCMDHLRDVRLLQGLWQSGNPPWKMWK